MTKDQYYDMCDMLGTEVIEADVPIEQEDLMSEILLAYNIYSLLAPKFDSFNGGYFGKDYSNLRTLFDMYEVSLQDQKEYFKIILILDSIDTEQINNRLKNRPAQSN